MLKRYTKILTLLMACGPLAAFAEFKNASYSYFALGSERTKYSEIATQSTLLAKENEEEWNVTNPFSTSTTVQTDQMSINQAGLDIIAAYHFKNGYFATMGLHYQKITFSRFNFESTADTLAFGEFALDNSDRFQTQLTALNDWLAAGAVEADAHLKALSPPNRG